jgi:hypothetical protein
MTGLTLLIGIVVFVALVIALAGPVRGWFTSESKVFLHDLPARDEIELEEAQREATAEPKPHVKPGQVD